MPSGYDAQIETKVSECKERLLHTLPGQRCSHLQGCVSCALVWQSTARVTVASLNVDLTGFRADWEHVLHLQCGCSCALLRQAAGASHRHQWRRCFCEVLGRQRAGGLRQQRLCSGKRPQVSHPGFRQFVEAICSAQPLHCPGLPTLQLPPSKAPAWQHDFAFSTVTQQLRMPDCFCAAAACQLLALPTSLCICSNDDGVPGPLSICSQYAKFPGRIALSHQQQLGAGPAAASGA